MRQTLDVCLQPHILGESAMRTRIMVYTVGVGGNERVLRGSYALRVVRESEETHCVRALLQQLRE